MSSNIRIEKICIFCKEKFIAKTFSTKYCTHGCNQKDYKKKVKEDKLRKSEEQFQTDVKLKELKVVSIDDIQKKTYLTIKEVCLLINISESTIRKLIKNGKLKTIRVGKKHFLLKSELNNIS
ncbi:helix-turn-helix domain-containing protein [Chryseobacterium artocarpi]|uniref:helix-turn-helix domain-containing protein n=1 Tax=Chryseobacterium artocarpi TaxID=1414727 RepID=UPI003F402862